MMAGALFPKLSSLLTITDEQAMWRVKMEDDPQAFARLVERWQVPIQRLCARMLGDAHRAEDLTQEAFVRVFARRKDYEPVGRFSTFLWRIALNLCYDELRKINRRGESLLEDGADERGEFEFAAEGLARDVQLAEEERAEGIRRALLQLPELYRVV